MNIEQLQAEIKRAVDEAYARGFREGSQSVAASIMQAAQAATKELAAPEVTHASDDHLKGGAHADTYVFTSNADDVSGTMVVEVKSSGRRAPRGLTEKALKYVLSTGLGLPMEEVQRRAKAFDSRISEKTVYNTLYREPEYWKDHNGRWRLLPPETVAEVEAMRREAVEQLPIPDAVKRLTNAPEEREAEEAPIVH